MLAKFWQWLNSAKDLLESSLEETNFPENSDVNNVGKENNVMDNTNIKENKSTIQDKDLEFLFNQLLEGVVNGWQSDRIRQFFEKLEHRITIDDWLNWLNQLDQKIMSSSAPNYQLAARMILLEETTTYLPSINRIGHLAKTLGEKWLAQSSNDNLNNSLRLQVNSQNNHKNKETLIKSNSNIEETTKEDNSQSFKNVSQDNESINLTTSSPSDIEMNQESTQKQNSFPHNSSEEESATYLSEKAQNWFDIGLQKASEGDFKSAIFYWNQVCAENKNFVQGWHNLGCALAYLNRLEEAVSNFEKAIAIDVNNYKSWNEKGNVLYSLKRWQEALTCWNRVIGIEPNHVSAWYYRGLALEKLNLLEEALQSYEEAIEINPNYIQAQKRKNFLLKNITLK